MAQENELIITPKTKVNQLLESYPELENILIEYAPAFKKLKNPVLRKTVAKVTSLQQAAAIANVNVEELINHMRKEVGQDLYSEASTANYNTTKPEWYDEKLVQEELDAKKMLDSGEQPVNQAISDLKKIDNGTIYKVLAPFLPAPLIDKASSLRIKHWVVKEKDDSFIIYFYKE
jgi:hypothetical protein